jgi:IclR family transcriptional regulator, KDG regulon repressor
MSDDQNNTNQSVARALLILDSVAQSKEKLGVRDIARRAELSMSICQRLVNTLTAANYLEQCAETRRYGIGYKAFLAGSKFVAQSDVLTASMPELQRLASEQRLNAYLGVLRDHRALYLATIQSESPIVIRGQPGESIPLHSTALGKSLLLDHQEDELDAELGPPPYQKVTSKTIITRKQLLTDLAASRARNYCISAGENLPDVFTVGAPIRDMQGRIIASLSGAIHSNDLPHSKVAGYGKVVAAAAVRISSRLGYQSQVRPRQVPERNNA